MSVFAWLILRRMRDIIEKKREGEAMTFHIALDSGGSKTESVLFSSDGRVLAKDRRAGANPLDIGFETAYDRYIGAVDSLLKHLPEGEKVSSLFGCVAGCDPFPQICAGLKERIGGAPTVLGSDTLSILSAMIGKEDGVCLISGTGSACQYRKDGKIVNRIGGYGYMLDTGGSGYVLGRSALMATLRAQDGRGEHGILTRMVEEIAGPSMRNHMPVIYAEGNGRPYIASFAPLVFAARRQGDPEAIRIFEKNTDYYAEALAAMLHFAGKPFKVVCGGSVFQKALEYSESLRSKAPVGCEIITLDKPVVYGAALNALWLCDMEAEAGFEENFLATFE